MFFFDDNIRMLAAVKKRSPKTSCFLIVGDDWREAK